MEDWDHPIWTDKSISIYYDFYNCFILYIFVNYKNKKKV